MGHVFAVTLFNYYQFERRLRAAGFDVWHTDVYAACSVSYMDFKTQ